jgi:hypothetical protein
MKSTDLHEGDRITYRQAIACLGQDGVPDQDEYDGPYKGVIVSIGKLSVQVSENGVMGDPLYEVLLSDIISHFRARA